MKRFLSVFSAALVLFGAGGAWAVQDSGEMPSPYAGSAELQKIKELAGVWEGPSPMAKPGDKMIVKYEVTSNGTAVVETLSPNTDHEMVSVYYDDNGKLAMTHYCAMGNQPHLKLEASSPGEISLALAPDSPIASATEGHMHSLALKFNGIYQLTHEWTSWKDGKPQPPTVFALNKVGEKPHADYTSP